MRAFAFSLSLALIGPVSLVSTSARAEVELPPAAPAAKLSQQVGLTEIGVDYDCPATLGRKIWGGVVPFDQIWLPGSHAATRIRFGRDVKIGGRSIPAGAYWLLAIPGPATWTVIINKSSDRLSSIRDYSPDLDVSRIKVSPQKISRRERLAYSFSDLTDDRASLDLEWESLRVSIPIQVNTSQQVQAAINGLEGTWRSYANAARYMLETKKDYEAGLKYIDQALALQADWYSMWLKGRLFAAQGDFAVARDWAERARVLAIQTGNAGASAPYLDNSIAEWSRPSGRGDKESHPPSKIVGAGSGEKTGEESRASGGEKLRDDTTSKSPPAHMSAGTAPPPFNPVLPASQTSAPREIPTENEPPALRRARLRHR
jgi:Protein of unknown function (DUF2911)